jgi:hypothetical protein
MKNIPNLLEEIVIINQNNKIMQKVLIIYVPFKRKEAIKKALHACKKILMK